MLCLVFYEERVFEALFKEDKNFRGGQHWNLGDLFLLKTGNKSLAFFLQNQNQNVFICGHSVWLYKSKFSALGTVPKSGKLNSLGSNL